MATMENTAMMVVFRYQRPDGSCFASANVIDDFFEGEQRILATHPSEEYSSVFQIFGPYGRGIPHHIQNEAAPLPAIRARAPNWRIPLSSQQAGWSRVCIYCASRIWRSAGQTKRRRSPQAHSSKPNRRVLRLLPTDRVGCHQLSHLRSPVFSNSWQYPRRIEY